MKTATKRKKIQKEEPKKMYNLTMKLNDTVCQTETDDLASAILAFKPQVLKTKVQFIVEKDGKTCERQLFVQKGKMVFRNKLFLDTFIRHLIFK